MAETLYDWCINNNRTDILSRWSKNNDISYQEINYGSSKKVLWVCSKGHEWHASPNKITQKQVRDVQNVQKKCKRRFQNKHCFII